MLAIVKRRQQWMWRGKNAAFLRRRAIYCALKYGLLPSWTYERERHYDGSYWAHLRLNVAYAWRWLMWRQTVADCRFERKTNWRGANGWWRYGRRCR